MSTGSFIVGLALILVGATVLLDNLGYGTRGLITQLQKLWPVIIIVIGIGVLGNGRIPYWLGIIITLVLVGGIVFLFMGAPGLVHLF
ncbi:MAG: hypothetical protein GX325_01365 [Peptococcaceae bacterium]|nr:hypothetical protein [Peptococcaceae bacterium]